MTNDKAQREKLLASAVKFVRDNPTIGPPNAAGITTLDIGEASMKVVVGLGWLQEDDQSEDCGEMFDIATDALDAVMAERGYDLNHATTLHYYTQREARTGLH